MFVYYYVHINRPFEDVEPQLLRMLPGLGGLAEVAYRDGEHLCARVGPGKGRIAKTVEVTVLEPVRGGAETWIPIEWKATGLPRMFPRMQGDVVVAFVGPALTQLALRGSYRVPLGKVGAAIDRTLLHRIAEASVKSFVDSIAEAIDAESIAASGGGAR